MVSISFIMITARTDFPYKNRPDLHLFEPTLECFKKQTMMDFEWVIVDALYEQRKNYFSNLDLPFKVKHIPALPNLWIENGFPGICTQYNKGIIYADGKLLFFTGDSHMVQPNFMQELWGQYLKGHFPLAWYFYDNSFALARDAFQLHADTNTCKDGKQQFDAAYPEQFSKAPVEYDILGFKGGKTEIEHRYVRCFQGNDRKACLAPWDWWFGCSSASLEAILKVNGFDQRFDGDQMLLDCDVGSRLDLAGYGIRFAIFRNIYLIKIPSDRSWNPSFIKKHVTIKCNLPLIWHSRYFNEYASNKKVLTNQDIAWIK